MEFRLFPHPADRLCTPYTPSGRGRFTRLYDDGISCRRVVVQWHDASETVDVQGWPAGDTIGCEILKHWELQNYLRKEVKTARRAFVHYVNNVMVVPTFSLCKAESFVRVVIRQLISAKQASRLFSGFVQRFGVRKGGVFGFPNLERLFQIPLETYNDLRLGMKARTIYSGIHRMNEEHNINPASLSGVGPWSKEILAVEKHKSYAYYPFWDKSGERIRQVCGVDLCRIACRQPEIAGEIYVYGASFLESKR